MGGSQHSKFLLIVWFVMRWFVCSNFHHQDSIKKFTPAWRTNRPPKKKKMNYYYYINISCMVNRLCWFNDCHSSRNFSFSSSTFIIHIGVVPRAVGLSQISIRSWNKCTVKHSTLFSEGKETITIANKQQHLLLLLPNEEKEKIPKMFWLDSLINVAKLTLTSFFAADDDDDLLFSWERRSVPRIVRKTHRREREEESCRGTFLIGPNLHPN